VSGIVQTHFYFIRIGPGLVQTHYFCIHTGYGPVQTHYFCIPNGVCPVHTRFFCIPNGLGARSKWVFQKEYQFEAGHTPYELEINGFEQSIPHYEP
jgi:hypothetical protein